MTTKIERKEGKRGENWMLLTVFLMMFIATKIKELVSQYICISMSTFTTKICLRLTCVFFTDQKRIFLIGTQVIVNSLYMYGQNTIFELIKNVYTCILNSRILQCLTKKSWLYDICRHGHGPQNTSLINSQCRPNFLKMRIRPLSTKAYCLL